MASTRNKNTPGNYELEQWSYQSTFDKTTYLNSQYGKPHTVHFAGNGLIHGRMAGRDLAKNDSDIESFLFGIGSTNLVKPLDPVSPEINYISSLNVADRMPMIEPANLVVQKNQRPQYWT